MHQPDEPHPRGPRGDPCAVGWRSDRGRLHGARPLLPVALLPLAAVTAALGYLATWIIARSVLVDGSFAESFADMVRLPDPDVAPTPENT
jgi:hypothetical protein